MEHSNGINAMMAHKARVYNDGMYIRSIINSYLFIGFGVVQEYSDGRAKIACGPNTYTNVELVVIGVDGWGVKFVPDVGERVLLFSTQSPIGDLKEFEATGSMPPYDPSGIKAIPITDSDSAQLITVSKDSIEITGDTQLSINSDGVSLTDANGNTIVTASDGVTINGKLHIKGGS